MRRPVTTTLLMLALAVIGIAVFVDRWADLREARIEAMYPPEGELVTVDGRAVHVVVTGSGPDVVLIHGAGGSAQDFPSDLVRRLSEREQARLLAASVGQLGATSPLVVGHSFGGSVAMAWALEDSASGVVILSGATMPWPGEVDWTYRVLGSRLGGTLVAPLVSAFISEGYVRSTLENVFKPQPVPDDYFRRAGVMKATRIATLRANARQVNTLRPHVVDMALEYPDVTIPVEIVHGTADRTVFLEIHAEPLERTLPNANLTELDGMGHMPHHWATDDAIAAIDRAAERAGLR